MKTSLMHKKSFNRAMSCLYIILMLGLTSSCTTKEKISKPGEYSGYSEAIYADEYDVSSQYVEMRDGVKLAVDICRPIDTVTGKVTMTNNYKNLYL